jgi:hypothetical protein
MTPISPIVTSGPFNKDKGHAAAPGRAAPVQSFNTSSIPATSPGQKPKQESPAPQSGIHQELPTNIQPRLVLEKANGSFEIENPLPSTHLRNSNVDEFFSFISETTMKPRDTFDTLTFTLMFIEGIDRTWLVHEGDEAAWNRLKKVAKFLSNLNKTRVEESEFQIVVEFGDKRIMGAKMQNW